MRFQRGLGSIPGRSRVFAAVASMPFAFDLAAAERNQDRLAHEGQARRPSVGSSPGDVTRRQVDSDRQARSGGPRHRSSHDFILKRDARQPMLAIGALVQPLAQARHG
jgi:hypothetical protein